MNTLFRSARCHPRFILNALDKTTIKFFLSDRPLSKQCTLLFLCNKRDFSFKKFIDRTGKNIIENEMCSPYDSSDYLHDNEPLEVIKNQKFPFLKNKRIMKLRRETSLPVSEWFYI